MSLLTDKADFQAWLSQPMTKAYLDYLRERRDHLAVSWAKGAPGSHLPETQAQAVLLSRLCELNWGDIRDHYQIEEKDDEEEPA